ncbi:MAG: substrate-binding domain-containing protein [Rhizobiales bacterium]|nr:substrate-binding domain-containing protein [Hyphomicrobiales bacterium]
MTSRQLARLIGVSQSAVSRAFTPNSSISPALRERVLTSARELGYEPNAIAAMLSSRKTNIVGIVVSDVTNPFYPGLTGKLSQGLQRNGLQSLLFNVTPGANIEGQLAALKRYNIDAVIVIAATVLSEPTLAWVTEGRNAVLVNRLVSSDLMSVCCDNTHGARTIIDHLHQTGRRKIAYVAGLTGTGIALARQHAAVTRMAELGMQLAGSFSRGVYSYEAGYQAALEAAAERPDAVMFANDILALGGFDALRDELGLDVPGDMAVTGFDDIDMASWPHYQLTTYRQPVEAIVEETLALITEGPRRKHRQISLAGELVVRRSSQAAAGDRRDKGGA